VWSLFVRSRRGYDPIPGFYTPPAIGAVTTDNLVQNFNPLFPTQFAGLFKPTSESGMVPQTCGRFSPFVLNSSRNPIPMPTLPLTSPADAQQLGMHLHADQFGMLDYYSRNNPVYSTLMRPLPDVVGSNALGLHQPTTATLFNDTSSTQRHPFTDLYPISRLQKLVTERTNVFAVYTTLALFEYNQATGNLGKEFGVDNGETQRFKAFYVIDRSVPVGFRIGEDHNIEDTILVRRIVSQ
jgi:hypothetical protein